MISPAAISQQPVAQAELRHQNRSIRPRRRHWTLWFDRAITVLIYGVALIMVANEIAGLFFFRSSIDVITYDLSYRLGVLRSLPIIAALVLHFRRMFQTLGLAANSIARERQANNWDMLVLTGIDARKIVRGKWWATVQHMWRPYVMLGVLRAAVVVWYGVSTTRTYIYYGSSPAALQLVPALLQFFLAGVAVFALTLANLLFTAACGVSAFNKRSGVALARAIGTRLFIIIAICLVGFLIYRWWSLTAYYNYSYNSYSLALPMIGVLSLVTLLDNGAVIGTQLATYNLSNYNMGYGTSVEATFTTYLPVVIISIVAYGLLTYALLRFAQAQAVRQSALPPIAAKRRKLISIV